MAQWIGLILFLLAASVPGPAPAEDVPQPTGRVQLVIDGKVSVKNKSGGLWLDLQTLEGLGTETYETFAGPIGRTARFEGIPISQLLDRFALPGVDEVTALGIDGYRRTIPVAELVEHDAFIALRQDGDYLSRRERGPLWIIFPDVPAKSGKTLLEEKPYLGSYMVWQLVRLTLR